MATRMVHVVPGTPTISWCDDCMTRSRVRQEFHTMTAVGVSRALTIDRCINDRHEAIA